MTGKDMFSVLRQSDASHVESLIASQYAMVTDTQIKSTRFESLEDHAEALHDGATLPIGSVKFLRKAMELAGITEPANLSYPAVLESYLRRRVCQRRAGSVLGHWFIKPTTTKEFTGFVFDTLGNPEHLSGYDRAQYNAFLSLSPDRKSVV